MLIFLFLMHYLIKNTTLEPLSNLYLLVCFDYFLEKLIFHKKLKKATVAVVLRFKAQITRFIHSIYI